MSLLHRASSTESNLRRASLASLNQRRDSTATDDESSSAPLTRSSSAASLSTRRLSYNPLSNASDVKPPLTPTKPDSVSLAKRLAQVVVAVIYCLLAAGIVFGFAALKPVLISEGVYRDQCSPQEEEDDVEVCEKQELRLNLMFTLAAVSTNVAALPIGTLLDRFGPRKTSLLGCFFLTLGALFLAFASNLADRGTDGYIPGYLFLALGGPCVFISSFQLSNGFPESSGLVLALLTGAFDTSSALFLIYRLIYQGTEGIITPQRFFLAYLVVPVLIAVAQLTLMPETSYQLPPPSSPSTDDEATPTFPPDTSEDTPLLKPSPTASDPTPGALHHLPASRQILSPYFILLTLFTILQMTRINFFVATIRSQYTNLISLDFAKQLNSAFDVALPLGGVAAVIPVGWLLDHLRVVYVLSILVTTATVIGVLGLIATEPAAYLNVILFVLYRPFYYTAVSDYSAKVFGFETFGTVYGLVICLAGLGNLSQSGLDAVVYTIFKGDFRPINSILLLTTFLIGTALVVYVWWEGRAEQRRKIEIEAEDSVGTAREITNPTGGMQA